jgi:hypothetical protein
MAAEFHGFDGQWLDRRGRFLLDRADAHLRHEDVRSRAFAATLLRDAAAIAFMQDDPAYGRKLLAQAGDHFLRLGLPYGMLLSALADGDIGGGAHLNFMLRVALATAAGQASPSEREDVGPLFAAALHQPEQLLALEATAALMETRFPIIGEGRRMERMLWPFREHPVGPAGVPVAAFMRLIDLGRGLKQPQADAPGNVQLDILTLFAQRGRQLASAAADSHHWRLLLSPAALLDFDMVALFAIWWAHDRQPESMVPNLGDRPLPMMTMPLEVARALRFPDELNPV